MPTFVPQELKWYKRDGLMTWYDQRKCQDFLEETDKLFEMLKLLILILLTNGLRVKKFVELLYRITKQLKKRGF